MWGYHYFWKHSYSNWPTFPIFFFSSAFFGSVFGFLYVHREFIESYCFWVKRRLTFGFLKIWFPYIESAKQFPPWFTNIENTHTIKLFNVVWSNLIQIHTLYIIIQYIYIYSVHTKIGLNQVFVGIRTVQNPTMETLKSLACKGHCFISLLEFRICGILAQKKVCRLNRCIKMNQLCVYIYTYTTYIYISNIYVHHLRQYDRRYFERNWWERSPWFPSHSKLPTDLHQSGRLIVTNKQQSNHWKVHD